MANILKYLQRWLDPWSPEREKAGDWRILMLDVATSHLDQEVIDLAHSRGYVVLFHFGCTTGVAQVNDTDLHAPLSGTYINLEVQRFANQQMLDPGNISRTIGDVVEDGCAAWRAVDHGQALQGHWRVGLANALDGSEDSFITREALVFWRLAGMAEERPKAIQEVDDRIASGEITTFAEWAKLVADPPDPGEVEHEGAEFEGELLAGEAPWQEEEDAAKDEAADEAAWASADGEAPASVALVAQPGDAPADVDQASVALRRLAQLKRLRSIAFAARVPAAAFSVEREVNYLERGIHAGADAEKKRVNAVLRREMDKRFADESARVKETQAKNLQARRTIAKVKAAASVKKQKVEKAAAEKKASALALDKKLSELPTTITPATVGAPGKKGVQARRDALERLKLRSPALPFAKEAGWTATRDAYAEHYPKRFPGTAVKQDAMAGGAFVKAVNKLLEALGEHYLGESKWKKAGGGDPLAFEQFYRRMAKDVPKPVLAATF